MLGYASDKNATAQFMNERQCKSVDQSQSFLCKNKLRVFILESLVLKEVSELGAAAFGL